MARNKRSAHSAHVCEDCGTHVLLRIGVEKRNCKCGAPVTRKQKKSHYGIYECGVSGHVSLHTGRTAVCDNKKCPNRHKKNCGCKNPKKTEFHLDLVLI